MNMVSREFGCVFFKGATEHRALLRRDVLALKQGKKGNIWILCVQNFMGRQDHLLRGPAHLAKQPLVSCTNFIET